VGGVDLLVRGREPQLRKGNAGSNTAADHITVLDAALAQLPDAHRHGTPILIRADGAGCTQEFLTHIRGRRNDGVSCEFSVGWAITERERAAVTAIPKSVWADAIDAERPRRHTGLGRGRPDIGRADLTCPPLPGGAQFPAATATPRRRPSLSTPAK
jgi:Transposase DDE domain group 1